METLALLTKHLNIVPSLKIVNVSGVHLKFYDRQFAPVAVVSVQFLKPPTETVDEDYPFWFSTGCVFAHYHTGTMTRSSPSLDRETIGKAEIVRKKLL